MANEKNRGYASFRAREQVMVRLLLVDAGLFVLYLIFAGTGITWGKVTFAIAALAVAGLGLTSLYLTREIRRKRSRYLVAGFAAVVVCLIFSLILNYPSPAPALPTPNIAPVSTGLFSGMGIW